MAFSYTRNANTPGDYLFAGIVLSIIGGVLVASETGVGWFFIVGGSIPVTIGAIALGVRVGLEGRRTAPRRLVVAHSGD